MTYPFVQCYHRSIGSNLPVTRIVIHGTVSPTVVGGALANAEYFQQPTSGGSAHYTVDPKTIVQCATDDTICWHAPPNQHSIGVELCDPMAGDASRWDDADHTAMLELAAGLVRDKAAEFDIPLTKLSVADLLAGKHGVCGHWDVSLAFHQSDHTDPHADFPWARFMAMLTQATPTPVPSKPVVPATPVHTPATPAPLAEDGGLGPATIRRWQQIMGTPVDGSISIPSSLVAAVQRFLNAHEHAGLTVDGKGIAQDGKKYATVAALQRHLGTPADGVLSRPSSTAVKALQARLNTGRF